MGPITVNVDLPTDNTDCLANSGLDPIPEQGTLLLYLASTQRDGIMTVGGPALLSGTAVRIPPVLRTNGIPDLSADVPITLQVMAGKLNVVYDEVTAGDAFLTALFMPS